MRIAGSIAVAGAALGMGWWLAAASPAAGEETIVGWGERPRAAMW